MEEAEATVRAMQEMYVRLKLQVQPLVFMIKSTGNAVVVYNRNRWAFETAVKAVDICFKLVHVSYGY